MLRSPVVIAALSLACLTGRAQAQVALTGGEMTDRCVAAAKSEQRRPEAIHICTSAIEHEALLGRNLAGLYVNRGVLELREADYRHAGQDFDVALSIDPALGEAWINRGADRIAQKQWRDGVADIDRGLTLTPEEPQKAYFNRAIAREHLDDVKGAYFDYSKASELAPAWSAPKDELKRFSVSAKPEA